jgi:hypothetical protein
MYNFLQYFTPTYTKLYNCDTEEKFFKEITTILINKLPQKNKVLTVQVSIPNNNIELFKYNEFTKWFVKNNFKCTFYSCCSYSPKTLYIDHIFINRFFISNDINELPINQITFSNNIINILFKPLFYYISHLFYTKNDNIYITMQFIIRKPTVL